MSSKARWCSKLSSGDALNDEILYCFKKPIVTKETSGGFTEKKRLSTQYPMGTHIKVN